MASNTSNFTLFELDLYYCYSTSNLQQKYFTQRKDVQTLSQPVLSFAHTLSQMRERDIDELIVKYWVEDNRPISSIQSAGKSFVFLKTDFCTGLKRLIHFLEPRYHIKGTDYYRDKIFPSLYLQVHSSLELLLATEAEYPTLCPDIWTSEHSNEAYFGLTVHFISLDWNLQVFSSKITLRSVSAIFWDFHILVQLTLQMILNLFFSKSCESGILIQNFLFLCVMADQISSVC